MTPAVIAVFALLATGSSAVAEESLRLDARDLHARSVTRNVRLRGDPLAVELEEGELFEDDGPAAGYSDKPNEQILSSRDWIRKELIVSDPRCRAATLLVAPGGDGLRAIINGRRQELREAGRVGHYWQAYPLDPGVLESGTNEIVLYGSGRVWIAREDEFATGSRQGESHPDRSARSGDAGKTWERERLTSDGMDGEYYVRLFLDHHRPRGSLTLPVIDVGNLGGRPVGEPVASIGPVRIALEAETNGATRFVLKVRSGTRYVPDTGWSDWSELAPRGGVLEDPAGRFLQVRVALSTRDPLRTPRLRALTVTAAPRRPGTGWTEDIRVLQCHNEEILRTSVPFRYEPFGHPRLELLRRRYDLDEVVRGAATDLDLALRLAGWSASRFSRDHFEDSYPPWDALEILKLHRDGTPVGGFCLQSNIVFIQACESFGLPARCVSVGPGDLTDRIRGGHEAAEIWSNEHGKWVYVDGDTAWYARDKTTGEPLSLLELRERQLEALAGGTPRPAAFLKVGESRHRWDGFTGWPPFVELRLIPRSNFLEEEAPLPLNQGRRGWFWTGHVVFSDRTLPARPLYGNRVSKPGDFNWTLNQARWALEATETPGRLRVHLDTETPGFETFLAAFGGGEKRPVKTVFTWDLHRGRNRLDVLPRNRAGREGIASWIVIEYHGGDRDS